MHGHLKFLLFASFIGALNLTSACSSGAPEDNTPEKRVEMESRSINGWFEARYQDQLARSPTTQTYLGFKTNQDKLDDVSSLAEDEAAALIENWLKEMRYQFSDHYLDTQAKLSYHLFEYELEDKLVSHKYADQTYVFDHMSGPHSQLPSFLINFHSITNTEDAEAYIARLNAVQTYLGQYAKRADDQANLGVLLPRFVYPKIAQASRNIITGAPFTGEELSARNMPNISATPHDGQKNATELSDRTVNNDSPLWADFKSKLGKLDLDSAQREELLTEAKDALLTSVGPAYNNLIDIFSRHEILSNDDDGVWKLPNGAAFYQQRLKHYTTTDMTADEIHEVGLKDVARIQEEMQTILIELGFEGSLQDFFTYLRTDPKFTYPNTDVGRAAYIEKATSIINEMQARQDELFITKPKADMIVKRVEHFREDTAFGAFYDQPSLDGSRPGTYYINLKDMGELPIYQMQALAYHEGLPGHHMQIAISMELEGLPKFRTLGGHTAYIEGWALYAEGLPKELGLYTDPYQKFGQLSMEIFRSVRLVVDTGIHDKKWTREQAVAYMLKNTANSEGDIRSEIDRYIVWPGQATAYKIGMLKIQNLRQKAEQRLGDKFDLRRFHDVILDSGSIPLRVLEDQVEAWIEGHE